MSAKFFSSNERKSLAESLGRGLLSQNLSEISNLASRVSGEAFFKPPVNGYTEDAFSKCFVTDSYKPGNNPGFGG